MVWGHREGGQLPSHGQPCARQGGGAAQFRSGHLAPGDAAAPPEKVDGGRRSVYETAREREKYAQLSEEAGIPEEVSYQPKYEIAVDLVDQAMAAGPDHACVVGDTGFGKYPAFRKKLRTRDKPYVLEVETSKFVVVPAETTVLEPGSTSGRGPPRRHPAYPEETDAETPEQIVDRLEKQGGEKQDGWREVTWNEGTKGDLSG